MVFLAITPEGLQDVLRLVAVSPGPVWCGADAISEEDFEALTISNVTRFDYSLADGEWNSLESALSTIAEHHPGERVWVEDAFTGKGVEP
ncbi:hypothetical protein JCM19000A_17770 [Silvimonas sp. JCM 19000]